MDKLSTHDSADDRTLYESKLQSILDKHAEFTPVTRRSKKNKSFYSIK